MIKIWYGLRWPENIPDRLADFERLLHQEYGPVGSDWPVLERVRGALTMTSWDAFKARLKKVIIENRAIEDRFNIKLIRICPPGWLESNENPEFSIAVKSTIKRCAGTMAVPQVLPSIDTVIDTLGELDIDITGAKLGIWVSEYVATSPETAE